MAFDLDHNNFVGAAEIRHVLVNIGENVTDEEVRPLLQGTHPTQSFLRHALHACRGSTVSGGALAPPACALGSGALLVCSPGIVLGCVVCMQLFGTCVTQVYIFCRMCVCGRWTK